MLHSLCTKVFIYFLYTNAVLSVFDQTLLNYIEFSAKLCDSDLVASWILRMLLLI